MGTVAPYCKRKIFYDENLMLEGLSLLLPENVKRRPGPAAAVKLRSLKEKAVPAKPECRWAGTAFCHGGRPENTGLP